MTPHPRTIELRASRVEVSVVCKGVGPLGDVYIVVGLGESMTSADYFALEVGAALRLRNLLGMALSDPVPKRAGHGHDS